MVRRGRPSLNLTPEERLQRRRSQLVASQRKRRAHQRLSQPSKPSTATPESHLPVVPTSLRSVYDAMVLGQSTEVAVLQQHGLASTSRMPSPSPQSPVSICHHCGSAPLDMASSMTEAMSPSSAASLLRTYQLGTDTHMLSSRLASPMPSSIWADYTFANESDDIGIDQDPFAHFTEAHFTGASSNMALLNLGINTLDHFGSVLLSELEMSSNRQKCDTHISATRTDNVFLPGLSGCYSISQWMPSSPPLEAGPTLTGATFCGSNLCSPVLCDDSVDLFTPWAGTKQAIPMGF